MFCEHCGSWVADDTMFCEHCGHPVASVEFASSKKTDVRTAGTRPGEAVSGLQSPDATRAIPQYAPNSATMLGQPDDPMQFAAFDTDNTGRVAFLQKNGSKAPFIVLGTLVIVLVASLAVMAVDPMGWFTSGSASSRVSTDSTSGRVSPGLFDSSANTADETSASEGSTYDTDNTNVGLSSGEDASGADSDEQASSSGYVLADLSTRYYTKEELSTMDLHDLYIARNEVFARYGRGFKNADLQAYFDSQDWYTQRYTPEQFDAMESPLNEYEKANTNLMLEVERERNSPYLS